MLLADYVIEWLTSNNINNIFTVSGGGSIALCDAATKSNSMSYYCCHNEQAAAFAAEGYARASKSIGATLVTTGPGGTNALTGVSSAWIDSIPLIFISGQVFSNQLIGHSKLRQLGVQEINIVDLVKPNTKYAVCLKSPNNIRYELEKAHHLALTGRPGPVWIDIPANMQMSLIKSENLKSYKKRKRNLNTKKVINQIKTLKIKLMSSKKPLILAGHGVRLSKSSTKLLNFAEKYNIPILTTWNASDIIESDHKLFIGRPGAFAERGANFAVQNADFLITLGTRLPYMVTSYNSRDFARNAFKIMVDIDNNELKKDDFEFDLLINTDVSILLENLLDDNISFKASENWIRTCQKIRKKYPIVDTEKRKPTKYVNSYVFIDTLSSILSADASVVTDMGLSFVGTHQAFRVKEGQNLFTNSGHAPMGWGLPAAFGSSIADKNKQVICLSGDGGLMMNIQEFATIMHHKPNLKVFIYNNNGYLTIKQTQQLGFENRLMGCDEKDLSFPKFDLIAKAHSLPYLKLTGNDNLVNCLKDFLKTKGPGICELIMDPEQPQVPKHINRKDHKGKAIASKFEELYPFLSENEIKTSLDTK
jgi:acetolactate synthase I/II/III large subunit